MSSNYNLTEQEIKEGIRLCKEKVNLLLDDAESIINRNHGSISSGLYTYAVEELGKLLLLQKELNKTPINGKISVDPQIFGQGGGTRHPTKKFNEFLIESSIPDKCKKLRIVAGAVFSRSYVHAGDTLIPIPQGCGAIHEEAMTDFPLRKKIFYVDWENDHWVRHQDVEIADLNVAIPELRNWMTSHITIS